MSSRKDQKETLRAEREARERAAAAEARRKRLYAYVAGGVLLAAVVVALLFVLLSGGGGEDPKAGEQQPPGETSGDFPSGTVPAPAIPTLDEAAQAAGCTAQSHRSEGEDHVPGTVAYKSNPPHSGDHFEVPAVDDAYTEAPPTEQLVHSLEHGRIIYWYKPGISDELLGSLKALYDEDPSHVLIAPRPDLPGELGASAWTETLTCARAKPPQVWDALRTFRDRHRDRGPENVP